MQLAHGVPQRVLLLFSSSPRTSRATCVARRRKTHQSALPFAGFGLLVDLKRLPDERRRGRQHSSKTHTPKVKHKIAGYRSVRGLLVYAFSNWVDKLSRVRTYVQSLLVILTLPQVYYLYVCIADILSVDGAIQLSVFAKI